MKEELAYKKRLRKQIRIVLHRGKPQDMNKDDWNEYKKWCKKQ